MRIANRFKSLIFLIIVSTSFGSENRIDINASDTEYTLEIQGSSKKILTLDEVQKKLNTAEEVANNAQILIDEKAKKIIENIDLGEKFSALGKGAAGDYINSLFQKNDPSLERDAVWHQIVPPSERGGCELRFWTILRAVMAPAQGFLSLVMIALPTVAAAIEDPDIIRGFNVAMVALGVLQMFSGKIATYSQNQADRLKDRDIFMSAMSKANEQTAMALINHTEAV